MRVIIIPIGIALLALAGCVVAPVRGGGVDTESSAASMARPVVSARDTAPPLAVVATAQPVQSKMGVFTHYVTKVADAENCNPQIPVTLTATGPGFETYSVLCPRGSTLAVQCDFGNCRLLK